MKESEKARYQGHVVSNTHGKQIPHSGKYDAHENKMTHMKDKDISRLTKQLRRTVAIKDRYRCISKNEGTIKQMEGHSQRRN